MSLLELHQNERGVFSSRKSHQEYFDSRDEPFSPPLFSAIPDLGHKTTPSQSNTNDTPLTPTSNSIRGTYSDTSEAASGETIPSSIAEDDPNASAQTLSGNQQKHKDSDSDRNTVTEIAGRPLSDMPTQRHLNKSESRLELANSNDEKAGIRSRSGSGSSTKNSMPPATNGNMSSSRALLPSNTRRHTYHEPKSSSRTSATSDFSRMSIDGVDRPQVSSFQSLRKMSTILRASSGDQKVTKEEESRNGAKQSATESELTKVKSTLVTKNIQRKKDVVEDLSHIVGNKITEGHQNFVMAYNMLTGIRVAVSRCSGVMRNLNDADFRATKKLTFDMDGTELTPSSKYDFKFKDYSPAVFRELRTLFGIDPADYLMSITGKYILSELGSSGKSGSFFYYSRDYRFIIKTIHHSEHKQLRRILKDYYMHVKNNPNTMISQFYGLHRLKVNGGMKRVHFLVMNNLFPPHRDIHVKYDLKGSTWGRYTSIQAASQNDDLASYTLKDLNWLENQAKIRFGPEKKHAFLEQLEADVKLLKKINVMDYSLLLGVHDVKKGNSETVAKLTVFDPKSNLKAEVFKTNPRDINRQNDLPSDVFPGRSKYIFYGHNGGIRATDENNDPLPEIYYLGIIDCLTNYSLRKRLETTWRSITQTRSTISAVPAREYGERFLKFIKDGISDVKAKLD